MYIPVLHLYIIPQLRENKNVISVKKNVKNDQKQKTARFRLWGGRQLEGDS
jgi:hypothetical protein